MNYDPREHHRTSIRLRRYDYSQAGAYFITVCTYNRQCILGDVVDGRMQLNAYGSIVSECWNRIPTHFADVGIDAFVVMPNHVHGTVVFVDNRRGAVSAPSGRGEETSPLQRPTLGQTVAYFKYLSTKLANRIGKNHGNRIWQRNYYEHVIRGEEDLNQIREYIVHNPAGWDTDSENPRNVKR